MNLSKEFNCLFLRIERMESTERSLINIHRKFEKNIYFLYVLKNCHTVKTCSEHKIYVIR